MEIPLIKGKVVCEKLLMFYGVFVQPIPNTGPDWD